MKFGKAEKAVVAIGAAVILGLFSFLGYFFLRPDDVVIVNPVNSDTVFEPWIETLAEPSEQLAVYSPKILIAMPRSGGMTDDLELCVENGYAEDMTVFISVEIPEKNTIDADTMLEYSPAPENAQKLIVVAQNGEITIPATTVLHLPVRLTVPKNYNLPNRWEIDIKVSEGGGFVTRGYIQRYLVTMR